MFQFHIYFMFAEFIYLFIFSVLLFRFHFPYKEDDEGTKRRQSLYFLYHLFECASHVCCTAICWIYDILVSFIVLNFVIILCGRIIHFYTMGCVWVFMYMYIHIRSQGMSIEHWLKRIHIKSTQLQKNTFLNSMYSLSLFLSISQSLYPSVYVRYICILKYTYSTTIQRFWCEKQYITYV